MISPFAPLHSWLRASLGSVFVRLENGGLYPAHDAIAKRMDANLCDIQTRAAVLRALADAGHSRPWALGSIWSPLTDEQAGRATAAILRAVGEDPSKPVGVVLTCVLEAWREPDHADRSETRYVLAGDRPGENLGYVVPACEVGPRICIARHTYRSGWRVWPRGRSYLEADAPPEKAIGPEIGDAGRLAADNAARALGCLMIEDLTS